MSRHNRDRRRLRERRGTQGLELEPPAPYKMVRRFVVTEIFTRQSEQDQWTLTNVNLDCGGLPTEVAAKELLAVATAVIEKVKKPVGAPGLSGEDGVIGDGSFDSTKPAPSTPITGGFDSLPPEVQQEVRRAFPHATEQQLRAGAWPTQPTEESTDGAQDVQQVRQADTEGEAPGAATDGDVRPVQ